MILLICLLLIFVLTYYAETDTFDIRIPPDTLRLLRVCFQPSVMLRARTRCTTDIGCVRSIITTTDNPLRTFGY